MRVISRASTSQSSLVPASLASLKAEPGQPAFTYHFVEISRRLHPGVKPASAQVWARTAPTLKTPPTPPTDIRRTTDRRCDS